MKIPSKSRKTEDMLPLFFVENFRILLYNGTERSEVQQAKEDVTIFHEIANNLTIIYSFFACLCSAQNPENSIKS